MQYTLDELEEWQEAYAEGIDLPDDLVAFLLDLAIEQAKK